MDWLEIVNVLTGLIAVASIIVRWTPTLKDDTVLLVIIKFIGKFIALNRSIDDDKLRK